MVRKIHTNKKQKRSVPQKVLIAFISYYLIGFLLLNIIPVVGSFYATKHISAAPRFIVSGLYQPARWIAPLIWPLFLYGNLVYEDD